MLCPVRLLLQWFFRQPQPPVKAIHLPDNIKTTAELLRAIE
jgi:hypothetical protein